MNKKVAAFLFISTLVPLSARASVLSSTATAMAAGTWQELGTQGFNVDAKNILTTDCVHSILAFNSELFWDDAQKKLYIFGSGHCHDAADWAAGKGIGLVSYDEATNAWTVHPKPPTEVSTWLPHAWDQTTFVPAERALYHLKYGLDERELWRYSLDTGLWEAQPTLVARGEVVCCGGLEYFPERGSLVFYRTLREYGLDSRSWRPEIPVPDPDRTWPTSNFTEHNPFHKVLLFGGGSGTRRIYKMDAAGNVLRMGDAPHDPGVTSAIILADGVTGKYLAYFMGPKVLYDYDLPGDRWDLIQSGAQVPFKGPEYGDYANMAGGYLPAHGVFVFIQWEGTNTKVRLYKPATGTPPSLPAVSRPRRLRVRS